MKSNVEESLIIDTSLRFALFGLECAFGVTLDGVECERIFCDSIEYQISAKEYLLHNSPRLLIAGRVDDYEPEMIHLRVSGLSGAEAILKHVIEGAASHALRMHR